MANANIKAVITAEDRASGTLKKFSGAVESANDKIVTGAKRAAFALTAAATAATGFAIKSAADFEQTRIGIESMLGSADKARILLAKISKFAADTPFEFPELAQATRQLVAFGFSADDAFDTMKNLGDVSSAVGAPINDLAYLMGTLRTQGRAFTIDIRQFAMRGIPIYESLAKVLKVNVNQIKEMIEEGKVGFPEVQKAFKLMTSEGGLFNKAMEKQSRSLSGLFSTLKDNIGFAARELVGITQEGDIKDGSILAKLKDAADALNKNLPKVIENMKQIVRDILPQLRQWATVIRDVAKQIIEYLTPNVTALWSTIVDKLLPALKNLWHNVIQPMIPIIGTALVIALGLALDAFNAILAMLTPLINLMAENKEIVWALVAGYVALKGALLITAVIQAVNTAIVTLGSGMGAATLQAVGLRGVLVSMAMPGVGAFAVLAGAALVAGAVIVKAGNDTKRAWTEAQAAIAGASRSDDEVIRRLRAQTKAPYSPEVIARSRATLQKLADTGAFASGGFTGQGGSNEVAGLVHKGEYVLPQSQVNQSTGMPKMGGTVNINVNVGMYAGSEMEKRRMAETLFNALKDVATAKNTTLQGMMQ